MSELRLPLEGHGVNGRALIVVEADDGRVLLHILGEHDDDPNVWRQLTPPEARTLAAALMHFAAEAER